MSNKVKFESVKMAVGETIDFVDYTTCKVDTRFGEATKVFFANEKGEIFRECFAQGGMMEFLNNHPEAKSITLKKKLTKGDLTFNVWC